MQEQDQAGCCVATGRYGVMVCVLFLGVFSAAYDVPEKVFHAAGNRGPFLISCDHMIGVIQHHDLFEIRTDVVINKGGVAHAGHIVFAGLHELYRH